MSFALAREEEIPRELSDGWELYVGIQSGIVQPLAMREWDSLPDDVVRQLLMIMEIAPQVAEAKQEMRLANG